MRFWVLGSGVGPHLPHSGLEGMTGTVRPQPRNGTDADRHFFERDVELDVVAVALAHVEPVVAQDMAAGPRVSGVKGVRGVTVER